MRAVARTEQVGGRASSGIGEAGREAIAVCGVEECILDEDAAGHRVIVGSFVRPARRAGGRGREDGRKWKDGCFVRVHLRSSSSACVSITRYEFLFGINLRMRFGIYSCALARHMSCRFAWRLVAATYGAASTRSSLGAVCSRQPLGVLSVLREGLQDGRFSCCLSCLCV